MPRPRGNREHRRDRIAFPYRQSRRTRRVRARHTAAATCRSGHEGARRTNPLLWPSYEPQHVGTHQAAPRARHRRPAPDRQEQEMREVLASTSAVAGNAPPGCDANASPFRCGSRRVRGQQPRRLRRSRDAPLAAQTARILFLNQYFHPDRSATSQLLTELCEDLAEHHDVFVVTGRAELQRGTHQRRAGWSPESVTAGFASPACGRRRSIGPPMPGAALTNYGTYLTSSIGAGHWPTRRGRRPDRSRHRSA